MFYFVFISDCQLWVLIVDGETLGLSLWNFVPMVLCCLMLPVVRTWAGRQMHGVGLVWHTQVVEARGNETEINDPCELHCSTAVQLQVLHQGPQSLHQGSASSNVLSLTDINEQYWILSCISKNTQHLNTFKAVQGKRFFFLQNSLYTCRFFFLFF